ncbi:MAG: 2-C-methyl-D-erythritol 2,4-cyclodiphosphate synthase [Clostridia bacterium]|nr:2-C-methyl-D-erythritol 2,4-cyclodiphosphate synthase [Clostridia bacterium]
MKISVIVCAAGRGERAEMGRNKLLVPFNGANALYYTLEGVRRLSASLKQKGADEVSEVIVTSSPEDLQEIDALCLPYGYKTVTGGATRSASVANALKEVQGEIVLIQDGARPYTTTEQYLSCIDCVKQYGSAVTAMPATDTTVIEKDGYVNNIPARNAVYRVQTPQGFYTREIKRAYALAANDGGTYTDDGAVYSRYISPARICPCGTESNKKLTYKEDFTDAANDCAIRINEAAAHRCGYGVDVHAFGKKQDFVTLCGVRIPCDTGLIAHSDGDVALHAVMDAILSAAGLKDIGHYFPDSDPAFKGADSAKLLATVIDTVQKKGLKVNGLSVAIQAEKPRLAAHIDKMVENLSKLTGAPKDSISVTAGTCEGLGFVGEGRGICAYCTAVLTQIR